MNKISAQDRSNLIRLASSLPVGDENRRAILAGLVKLSAPYKFEKNEISGGLRCRNQSCGGNGKPGKKNVYNLLAEYGEHKGEWHDPQADMAGYMRWWRQHQGEHKDRTVSPTGARNETFNPQEKKKKKKK
jgi:hypothetical protein